VSSSVYYSIVVTAKENHLNPREYTKYLLEKLPSAKKQRSGEPTAMEREYPGLFPITGQSI